MDKKARLIDAESLYVKMARHGWWNNSDRDLALSDVDNAPTIDHENMRQTAEWKDKNPIRQLQLTNIPVVECSNCGIAFCDIINNHHYMYHFCPYCGAKMED